MTLAFWAETSQSCPNAPAARGDIIAIEEDGRLILRRYLVIRKIPHTLAENRNRPDLRHAVLRETHGVLWGLIRRQIGSHPARYQPRKQYSYSRDSLLPGSNKTSFYEHSASSSLRGAEDGHSYSREAFITRSTEPPIVDRIDSKPWDGIEMSNSDAARKTKRRSGTGNQGKIKRTEIEIRRDDSATELPQPPGKIGLNEAKSHRYRSQEKI